MNPWIKEQYTVGKPFLFKIKNVDFKNQTIIAEDSVHISVECDPSLKDHFSIRTFSSGDFIVRYGTPRSLV